MFIENLQESFLGSLSSCKNPKEWQMFSPWPHQKRKRFVAFEKYFYVPWVQKIEVASVYKNVQKRSLEWYPLKDPNMYNKVQI